MQEQVTMARAELMMANQKQQESRDSIYRQPEMKMIPGSGTIYGKIADAKGHDGIPGATVRLKGYTTGVVSGTDGTFKLSNIRAGQYVLQFSGLGYISKEVGITVYDGNSTMVNTDLITSTASLNEVVVVGYGTSKKRDLMGSVATVRANDLTQVLQGKVAGVNITTMDNGRFGADTKIQLRGIRSLTGESNPLLIVDGVVSELKNLSEIDPNDIASVSTLKDASAVALYGSRAANGVIIVTTKGFNPKMMREEFRDYAFWKPNLITDENGEVKFAVTYPDNITSWQTYVVGMDKKHHITKALKLVKSFKPMLAQLAAPQFLIEGDSAIAIGKKINYTTTDANVKVDFSLNGKQQVSNTEIVKANDATISNLAMHANAGADTITARFSIKATTGFADGELRKIPVFKKGTMETIGQFNILEGDTAITVAVKENTGVVKLYAQNNTFDLLLDEIEHLKKYPYYCMEQTASKLTGLVMEKKIKDALQQNFVNEKEMNKLLTKLQKGQLFDGSWGWWEGSRANISITNYITRALLQLRGGALLETNIRNALLYLNNELPKMDKYDLLETLYTLNEAGHDMDYNSFFKRLVFDSLTQHQQWQMLSVLQTQKLDYEKELQKLLKNKTATMLGGIHWGNNGYWWSRNEVATTVLAYKTLSRISGFEKEQKQITQYFLEKRKEGHWQNTVESATILSALLPDVLKANQNFTAKATLHISGDTSIAVNKFPFAITLGANTKNIVATKNGGGVVYFTAYQQVFNAAPQPVDSNFKLKSYFENNQKTVLTKLKAGEKAKLKVEVEVLKDADYVQIEIPIPAGCTYGTKYTASWYEHREYFRDRVLIFIEKMNKGNYTYEIEVEPRYSGQYIINPAKAVLMYFPLFYGRNGLQKVIIE
jgi:alpha-2-macroglobulin